MCLPVLWAGAGGWGLLAAADCDGIVSQLEDGELVTGDLNAECALQQGGTVFSNCCSPRGHDMNQPRNATTLLLLMFD